MPTYYFHCSDGRDVVFDRRGRNTELTDDLRLAAESAAQRLMRSVPGYPDWSGWFVSVYDREGCCREEVPFPPPLARRAQAQPRRKLLETA